VIETIVAEILPEKKRSDLVSEQGDREEEEEDS